MPRILYFLLLIAALTVVGCAHSLKASGKAKTANIAAAAQTELEHKVVERMQEEEEIFDVLTEKIDEYQNLLATCDSISTAAEDSEIKASCTSRLKAMRQELGDLSDLLRD